MSAPLALERLLNLRVSSEMSGMDPEPGGVRVGMVMSQWGH